MSSKLHPTWKKCIGYTVLAVFATLTLGLVSTSYTAIFSVLIGIVLAWPTRLVFTRLIKILQKHSKHLLILILFFISFFILLIPNFFFKFSSLRLPAVEEYRATVNLVDSQSFLLQEYIILPQTSSATNEEWIELPSREISARQIGLLLGELKILPLEMDSTGHVSLTLPNGTTVSQSLCGDYCPKVTIELIDFPKDSFYQAKYSEEVERRTYLSTETITWSSQNPDRGLFFAYILPPFHQFRVLLTPFLNIYSISQWLLALLALFCTVIIAPVVKPVLTDIAKEKLSSLLRKKPKKKLKIFISSKGEEKEIDIDE